MRPYSAFRVPQFAWVALALVVFAGVPFALGKYFELNFPDPFDSGCYVYSANHVLSGARIGFDEKPSAQAGTLLMNMLGVSLSGFNETGSKVLQGLFQAAALTVMFLTLRRLYGRLAAVVGVVVASVYLSAPVVAKYGNVKEQFMIAFMIMGICSFVWYKLTGRWWWVVLTGVLLIWGPMFKQTGMSAIGAVGLFVLAQPVLRRGTWKSAGKEVLLLVAGAAITLTPICLWYTSMGTPMYYWPYSFITVPAASALGIDSVQTTDSPRKTEPPAAEEEKADRGLILRLLPGYVSNSWATLGAAERVNVAKRVLRYYGILILPIALALGAVLARAVVLLRRGRGTPKAPSDQEIADRFVPLFGLWWFFDMAFVWISPHTYEQYFLPLNASSAMLGSYLVGLYTHRLSADRDKTRWIVLGLVGLVLMLVLSWHIFFGIARSPHSGVEYRNQRTQEPERTRGYVQKWDEIAVASEYPWVQVGRYMQEHSERTDKIYVWGWVPGIYVQAQRMSPAPKAFEGTMHTLPPHQLADRVHELVEAFEKEPPKFIVDTQNRHFPWDRPPLNLWPNVTTGYQLLANPPRDNEQASALLLQTFGVQMVDLMEQGFLRPDRPAAVQRFDAAFAKALGQAVEPAEARRYEALKPLRSYIMTNYQIVGQFGAHILFRHK